MLGISYLLFDFSYTKKIFFLYFMGMDNLYLHTRRQNQPVVSCHVGVGMSLGLLEELLTPEPFYAP